MTWQVLLFAHLRETHGKTIEIEAGPSVNEVFAALQTAGLRTESCRLAADDEFVRFGDPLKAGQTLALIPPVSGG